MSESPYQLGEKRIRHLGVVDDMPPGLRACVHDYGFAIVNVFLMFGIRDPDAIRSIVREVWFGPRQEGQRMGPESTLDMVLAAGPVTYGAMADLLAKAQRVIVPTHPTKAMVEASMAEVSGHNVVCTKYEKHRRRLEAAIRAASVKGGSAA